MSNQQRRSNPRTCSCCGDQGHTINRCNSPRVIQFDEEAIAIASTSPSVLILKNRRPFTSASLPVMKAIASKKRIETSVSNLLTPYITHLLAVFYWNAYNPAGSHVNNRDIHSVHQLAQRCKEEATAFVQQQVEAVVQQRAMVAEQQEQQELERVAQHNLRIFNAYHLQIANQQVHIENQRRHTRQAFLRAGMAIPDCVSRAYVMPGPAPASARQNNCLCCYSSTHSISNCTHYDGIPSMCKMLCLFYCSRTEFRKRLQQHPNLYVYVAYAIQLNLIPKECLDSVFAMNKLTEYYYSRMEYSELWVEVEAYKIGQRIESSYKEETGYDLESNVLYDPRTKFIKQLIETCPQIDFTNLNNQEFVAKCVSIAKLVEENIATPFNILYIEQHQQGQDQDHDQQQDQDNQKEEIQDIEEYIEEHVKEHVKEQELKEEQEKELKEEEEELKEGEDSCPVCLTATAFNKNPSITFGCNHKMCSKCLNTYLKSPNKPKCHICRQQISRILVPSKRVNAQLFEDIRVRIIIRDIDAAATEEL